MIGSGTQTDPFLVDNWADFCTIDTNSAEIYVRWADSENKVIDFNEIKPEGFSTTVNFPAHVDFNGWTLRNFHSTNSYHAINLVSSNSGSTAENLIFENFYTTSSVTFYGACMFKNCVFSGISQSTGNATFFHGCGLLNCSLNVRANSPNWVELANGGGFSSPKTQITNSDIILDILCSTPKICDSMIKNSRISGKIQSNALSITLGNASSMSNVFNLETNAPLYYQGTGISVYNSGFAEKSSDSSNNFIGVTSEQLKNAEYLQNIGFPIGVD